MWYSQLFMKYTKCRVGNIGRLLTLLSASRFLMRLDKRTYKSPEHSCLHTHSWFSLSDRLFPFCYMNIIHVSNTHKIPYLKKNPKRLLHPKKVTYHNERNLRFVSERGKKMESAIAN